MQLRQLVTAFKALLIVLSLVVLSAVPVHAVDGKNYPGSMCVRFSGPTPVYGQSAIGNPSTTAELRLDCPVVKDENNIRSGWVRVIDRHTTASVGCNLNCVSRSGSTPTACSTPLFVSVGSSDTTQHLSFGSLTCSACNSFAHYYYSCRIPPTQAGTSWIWTYQVLEND
jgi:hypothetical protein